MIWEPSRWCPSGKSLGPRGLLPLWSQVQALWLLIWWPLEAYMVVNLRARGISRGTRKLARTPMLNWKKKKWYGTLGCRCKLSFQSNENNRQTNVYSISLFFLTITCPYIPILFHFFNYFLDVRVSTFSQRKTMKLSYNIFLWKELVGKENEGG
jgi:hypothetical protein